VTHEELMLDTLDYVRLVNFGLSVAYLALAGVKLPRMFGRVRLHYLLSSVGTLALVLAGAIASMAAVVANTQATYAIFVVTPALAWLVVSQLLPDHHLEWTWVCKVRPACPGCEDPDKAKL
jgi:hypothetical protein